jgi:dipeptidyl aminopeptidase/acylaminoacyl peptidase
VRGRVFKMRITPHWFQDNTRFWYRNDLRGGNREFVVVDAERGKREPAFDHKKLAAALSKAAGKEYRAARLPFDSIEFVRNGKAVQFEVSDTVWECDLKSYECSKAKPADKEPQAREPARADDSSSDEGVDGEEPRVGGRAIAPQRQGRQPGRQREQWSPDGKWAAFIKDHNIHVRSKEGGKETKLSQNGVEGNAYGLLSWAPDSKTLLAFRIEPGDRKEVYLVESSPRGGGRARLHTRPYPLPGDKFTAYEPWVFNVENKKGTKVDMERIDFGWPSPRWQADRRHFTLEKTDRGHQRFRLIEVDARTGKTRNLIDEKSKTFLWTAHGPGRGMIPGIYLHYLDRSAEILLGSERDGWRHLYLIDARAGKVKNQITRGPWVVRGIDRVDEKARQIWFRASGKNAGQDPYLVHYYRVNFDGTGLVALTAGDGSHTVQFSPDRKYLIDTYSRVDLAPVHELRRSADGKLVCKLERADISALQETGWKHPEVFHAKGRDGKTDIWGIVHRPRKLDESRKYPVIEAIYAGPHGSHVPKTFMPYRPVQGLAELGFMVVQIDGMGTANRSKAFHDVCWKNLADAGFPDRILWIKALARRYPYLDTSRVGIYGTSAGGQNSTGALLFHPEFYKAAVSACGCHDNRMDKSSWNEQWMGYPVGPHYAANSNITHAGKLRGKLLLIVGELDNNVPPESTMRLVDALIKAGKDFDLLVVPGMGHSNGGRYGDRRLKDFFVRHLHGVEPPDRNAAPPGEATGRAPRVREVPEALRETLQLAAFYKKYVDAKGFPVLGSDKVSDEAVLEATRIINHMLADREDIRQALIKNKVRCAVMAATEKTTDVPEHSDLKPKAYWDRPARGLGPTKRRPAISCAEENLLNLKGDRYSLENILVHEFGHAIHEMGLNTIDPKFDPRLRAIYKGAMEKGLWKKTYAATNYKEYWAEGVQSYFDTNAPPGPVHNDINTREKLAKYDPGLFKLLDQVFKKSKWRYIRYDKRKPRESSGN